MEIPKNCEGCLARCVCETMNVPGCDECVEFHKLVEEKLTSTNKQSMSGCSKCGCRIVLAGYCAGCQTLIDQQ